MNSFHINLGRMFERPYESGYATIRRCLSVNPGISYSAIEKNLRKHFSSSSSTLDRIRSLSGVNSPQLSPQSLLHNYGLSYSFKRQCPDCARELYHTDIYSFAWLTRCPIHHSDLTTVCPECGEKWPDYRELSQRDCPCCGLLSLENLATTVLPAIHERCYQSIIDLYDLIEKGTDLATTILEDPDDPEFNFGNWHEEITVDSPFFAAVQARRHSRLSRAELNLLGINNRNIQTRTTTLHPEEEGPLLNFGKSVQSHNAQAGHIDMLERELGADLEVIEQVLRWISCNTSSDHEVHVDAYRRDLMQDFIEWRSPCPYCLAFSTWLWFLLGKHWGYRPLRHPARNSFLWYGGLDYLFCGYEPVIVVENRRLIPDPSFSIWFYRRGLEIAFLDILRFAFSLTEILEQCKTNRRQEPINIAPFADREFSDRQGSVAVQNGQLAYYYINEHPLETSPPKTPKNIGTLCRIYQEDRIQHDRDASKNRLGIVSGNEVDLDAVRGLVGNFYRIASNQGYSAPTALATLFKDKGLLQT